MKNALIRGLMLGAMSASAASASALDLQKVYDVLQAPLAISTKASLLQIQEGRIVATYGAGEAGLTAEEEQEGFKPVEDCRQVAIRQALLDSTVAGDFVKEISRKNSHRIDYVLGQENGVEVMVGLKVVDANGADQKRTYTYILSDGEGEPCKQVQALPVINDSIKKDAAEAKVLNTIIPTFSPEELQARKTAEEVETNEKLADKMVGKVLKRECDQLTINRAIELSVLAFKGKFASNPVVLFDWEQSRVKDGEQLGTGTENDLQGFWIVRMVDASGTQSMKTQLNFDVKQDAAENCGGSIDSAVTELN